MSEQDGLNVKGDVIRVSTIPEDAKGQPIEPEEHAAEHSIVVGAPLTFAGQAEVLGEIPGSFDYQTTAGEIAIGLRHRCGHCIHLDVARWRQARRALEYNGTPDQRQFVNEIRWTIEQNLTREESEKHMDAQTGEVDLEHVLDAFGLCNALTEIFTGDHKTFWPMIVLPECGCPDFKGPCGEDLSNNFKPKDPEAQRQADAAYDTILRMTQPKGSP